MGDIEERYAPRATRYDPTSKYAGMGSATARRHADVRSVRASSSVLHDAFAENEMQTSSRRYLTAAEMDDALPAASASKLSLDKDRRWELVPLLAANEDITCTGTNAPEARRTCGAARQHELHLQVPAVGELLIADAGNERLAYARRVKDLIFHMPDSLGEISEEEWRQLAAPRGESRFPRLPLVYQRATDVPGLPLLANGAKIITSRAARASATTRATTLPKHDLPGSAWRPNGEAMQALIQHAGAIRARGSAPAQPAAVYLGIDLGAWRTVTHVSTRGGFPVSTPFPNRTGVLEQWGYTRQGKALGGYTGPVLNVSSQSPQLGAFVTKYLLYARTARAPGAPGWRCIGTLQGNTDCVGERFHAIGGPGGIVCRELRFVPIEWQGDAQHRLCLRVGAFDATAAAPTDVSGGSAAHTVQYTITGPCAARAVAHPSASVQEGALGGGQNPHYTREQIRGGNKGGHDYRQCVTGGREAAFEAVKNASTRRTMARAECGKGSLLVQEAIREAGGTEDYFCDLMTFYDDLQQEDKDEVAEYSNSSDGEGHDEVAHAGTSAGHLWRSPNGAVGGAGVGEARPVVRHVASAQCYDEEAAQDWRDPGQDPATVRTVASASLLGSALSLAVEDDNEALDLVRAAQMSSQAAQEDQELRIALDASAAESRAAERAIAFARARADAEEARAEEELRLAVAMSLVAAAGSYAEHTATPDARDKTEAVATGLLQPSPATTHEDEGDSDCTDKEDWVLL
mmetsp:Transcript_21714/g.58476  ORF Transcript_21714/g.58476 Transcript_21714/m.58476 type:complete len:746 (-) Transcript_21714:44-2281(-)